MKPNWKPATDAEIDEMEKACRKWWHGDSAAEPPDIGTDDIMALILRLLGYALTTLAISLLCARHLANGI